MKNRLWLLTVVLVVVLLFALLPAVSADSNAPIKCKVDMDWNGAYWAGTVYGCILEGSVRYDPDPEKPSYVAGTSLHFFERFVIEPFEGEGKIYGTTAGVGHTNQPPFQFIANGWVTDATGSWTHLIGNKYFEKGLVELTADPAQPLTVEGMVMRIAPANR